MDSNRLITDSAHRSLMLAQQVAYEWHHESVTSGHLLYVLADEQVSNVSHLLNVPLTTVRKTFFNLASSDRFPTAIPVLDHSTTTALEIARAETKRLKCHYLGNEFLLLGVIQAEGEGQEVLEKLGLDLTELRNRIEMYIKGSTTYARPPHLSDLHDLLRALITQPSQNITKAAESPEGMLELFGARNPPGWPACKRDPVFMSSFQDLVQAYVSVAQQLSGWNTTSQVGAGERIED